MRKGETPLMEVDLHKWIHKRWPCPVFKKIGINDPGYATVCALFLKEERRVKNDKSHFLITAYYEFEGFTCGKKEDIKAIFAVNKRVLCMLIDDNQEVSLKNTSEKVLDVLKSITGTTETVVKRVPLVESIPMPRISNENGSRGAVIEDVYWRFVKE